MILEPQSFLEHFFIFGDIPSNAATGIYIPFLIFLSYVIASLGSFTGLRLATDIHKADTEKLKSRLHFGGALAFGTGIWSMHFIGMLAYDMDMVHKYDPVLTVLSMVIAIVIAYGVLQIIRSGTFKVLQLLSGAILLGLAICAMHYTGMAAMDMDADLRYIPWLFGLSVVIAVSYADTEVDSQNVNRTDTKIESYQATLYGDYDVDERTYISGSLAYAHNENETTRHDVGGVSGLNASGDFDSEQIAVQVETGRRYKRGEMILTPRLLAHYMYYNADDYTETGAGGASLSVANESLQTLELGLGLDASWEHKTADGSTIVPELRVGYRYDVMGDAVQSTSSFTGGGASFKTEGFDPAQSIFNAGAGVTLHTTNNWELTANYDFEYKSDYDAHSGSLKAAYRF